MWNLDQLEAAFEIFKQIRTNPKKPLDVWWCDNGLCVFGCPSPEELQTYPAKEPPPAHLAYYEGMVQEAREAWTAKKLARLQELCWHYQKNDDQFGERCWYLFRSD